jgi:hypothetical protein
MAFNQDLRRFTITTGTVPTTSIRGVVDEPGGRCWYQEYSLAANDYTPPIVGKISDLSNKYGAVTGYVLTYIDPDEPDGVSVSPTSGTASGGTAITITGTGLNSASCTVTVGGVAATLVRTASAGTTITCTTGAHATGAVDIVITTAEGTDTMVGAFTYT